MEDKLKSFTTILLIGISFLLGFLICDYITETEVIVQMSGGELYYDSDGNERKEALEQSYVERIVVNENAYIVNINTASKAELTDIPYVGEKTAEKIISYRENNHFTDIRDIMNVEGIGEKTFEKIKDYISVE